MNTTKKQHYVPQFYLKNFGNDGGIYVFEKETSVQYSANIRDVAQERFFYELPFSESMSEEIAKNGVEKYLESFDTRASNDQPGVLLPLTVLINPSQVV